MIQEIDFPMMKEERILIAGLRIASLQFGNCDEMVPTKKNLSQVTHQVFEKWIYLPSPIWSSALFLLIANEIVATQY